MSWDNGQSGLIKEAGVGRGLFFRNDIDLSMEGWLCESKPLTLFGWECLSVYFPPEAFDDVEKSKDGNSYSYKKVEGEDPNKWINDEGKPIERPLPNIFPKKR